MADVGICSLVPSAVGVCRGRWVLTAAAAAVAAAAKEATATATAFQDAVAKEE